MFPRTVGYPHFISFKFSLVNYLVKKFADIKIHHRVQQSPP